MTDIYKGLSVFMSKNTTRSIPEQFPNNPRSILEVS